MNLGLMKRRVAQKKDDCPYIKDNLLLWLDGINRGTNDASKWVDLIGGLTFQTQSGDNATWGNNHLVCSETMICNNYNIDYNQELSFEAVFMTTEKKNLRVFCNKSLKNNRLADAPALGLYSNNYLCTNGAKRISFSYNLCPINTNNIVSIIYTSSDVYINGVKVQTGTVDYYMASNDYAYLGYNFNGKLYSIRMYGKSLTSAEILHNHIVDNKRFDLGLTI